jgi:3-methyladenine DNA glycosylase AlkD
MRSDVMSESTLREIRREIRERSDPEKADHVKRYFREPIETYGVSSSDIKEIAKRHYTPLKKELKTVIEVADSLIKSRNLDEASVGIRLMQRMARSLDKENFELLDGWVDHLPNWANTDGLSIWVISPMVKRDPNLVERLIGWTASSNRWRRRAAAVSLVPTARGGEMLEEAFTIADRMMEDDDDMVQKGVGWLLKEASKKNPEEVRSYLLKWRDKASALVLRYASEKLPKDRRVLKTR